MLMFFVQPRSQDTRATRSYLLFTIFPTADVLLVFIFFCENPLFLLYSVAWVDAVSNMCDNYLFLPFDGLPHAFLFVYELLINPLSIFLQNL